MLAAIMTNMRWTWSSIACSSLGYALIFWFHQPLPAALGGSSHHGHHETSSFSLHLQGMWVAYTIAALAIGLFVSRLSRELQHEREQRLKGEKLLGLAALAAGAAHEVGNPLGTIRVVTSDLESVLRDRENTEELLQDLNLINEEIDRARRVLNQLSRSAGELSGEPIRPTDVLCFFQQLQHREDLNAQTILKIDDEMRSTKVSWPQEAVSQALIQLLRNAHQASAEGQIVKLSVSTRENGVTIKITDQGYGMNEDTINRYGEPFFTTREENGMGLGVFVARSLIDRLGGQLDVQSTVGEGTSVFIWLPTHLSEEGREGS